MNVFNAFRGSLLYGTNSDHSDIDVIDVFLEDAEFYLSVKSFRERKRSLSCFENKFDIEQHEFLKFINILIKGNPNSIDYLFNTEWASISSVWKTIIENRELFLSQQVFKAISGMALSEYKIFNKIVVLSHDSADSPNSRIRAKKAYAIVISLRKGIELFETRKYTVNNRKDIQYLKELKNNKVPYPDMKAIIDNEFIKFEQSWDAYISSFREYACMDSINSLTYSVMKDNLFSESTSHIFNNNGK